MIVCVVLRFQDSRGHNLNELPAYPKTQVCVSIKYLLKEQNKKETQSKEKNNEKQRRNNETFEQQTFIVGSVQNAQSSRRCFEAEMGTTSNIESGIFNTKDARK